MKALLFMLAFFSAAANAEHGAFRGAGIDTSPRPPRAAYHPSATQHPPLLARPALFRQTMRFRYRDVDIEAVAQRFCVRENRYEPGYLCGNFANGMWQELQQGGVNALVYFFGCDGAGAWRHATNVVEVNPAPDAPPDSHTFCILEPQGCERGPCWNQRSRAANVPPFSNARFWNELQAFWGEYRTCIASGAAPYSASGVYPSMPSFGTVR